MFDSIVSAIGKFSYKYRKVICGFATILFLVCIVLESQAVISYTYSDDNKIAEVFPQDDNLVIVYENQNEAEISGLIETLSKNEHVTSIQSYANTLGVAMTPQDLAENFGIDVMFVNLIFNMYYNGQDVKPMTLVEFTDFITSDSFLNNDMLSNNINDESKQQLLQLKSIINAMNSDELITAEEISKIVDMDVSVVKTILFFTQFNTDEVAFKDFVHSINKLTSIADSIVPEDAKNQIASLNVMLDYIEKQTLLNPSDIVSIFASLSDDGMFNEDHVKMLYLLSQSNGQTYEPITLYDFILYLSDHVITNEIFSSFITEDISTQLSEAKVMVLEGKEQLVGPEYSRMILTLNYKPGSDEIKTFYNELEEMLNEHLRGDFYMVGQNAMAHEVEKSFNTEYTVISIITAIVVLVVVCISFKKIAIPVLLVCVIECSVFAMMSVLTLLDFPMFFIALILVQCILMGSMIDYAILLTTYYIEVRRELPVECALPEVMRRATHAILTSSLILITVSFICGAVMTGQVANILLTLGVGSLCAILLILFVLPALLVTFDRYLLSNEETNTTSNMTSTH